MIARQPGLTGKQAKKGTQEHQAAKMQRKKSKKLCAIATLR